MKYSLFFNILFIGLCGVYAKDRHIRSLPRENDVFESLIRSLLSGSEGANLPDNLLCPVPEPGCPNDYITFWYYSSVLGTHPIPVRDSSGNATLFSRSLDPWKVIIPGFAMRKDHPRILDIISAYGAKGKYNILVIDYYELAKPNCYKEAVRNMKLIAECSSNFIDGLVGSGVFPSEKLHVIGIGLGGQIAFSLHKYIKSGRLGRVTALDPYSLHYEMKYSNEITKEAAIFTDTFHTNTFRTAIKSSHAEFYFNSGVVQPGCLFEKSGPLVCSHDKSIDYYIESIRHAGKEYGFYGIPCKSFWWFATLMCDTAPEWVKKAGEDGNIDARGRFYLQTRSRPPYALGKNTKFIPPLFDME